jgi:hypothetical protein
MLGIFQPTQQMLAEKTFELVRGPERSLVCATEIPVSER